MAAVVGSLEAMVMGGHLFDLTMSTIRHRTAMKVTGRYCSCKRSEFLRRPEDNVNEAEFLS
jgi:hypothetical protein